MAFEMPRVSKPEDVGFSSQRLQLMRDAFQADVDTGIAVVLVARHCRARLASIPGAA